MLELKEKFSIKPISVRKLADIPNFVKTTGAKAINRLEVGDNILVGEYVYFGGTEFKAVANKPCSIEEFQIGATANETSSNLATAIIKSDNGELKKYTVSVSGATIEICQLVSSPRPIPIQGSINIPNIIPAVGAQGGLNLSGIYDTEDFIDSARVEFSLTDIVESANGDNAAKQLASLFGNAEAIRSEGHDRDRAALFKAVIVEKIFRGAIFYPYDGNMNNRVLEMSHPPTGEYFIIETSSTYDSNRNGDIDCTENAKTIATRLNSLFELSIFCQTRVLNINTDKSDICNSAGTKIASLNGVSVSLTSTSFKNKVLVDFKIANAEGGIKFTALIESPSGTQKFTNTIIGADLGNLVQGYKLDLIDAASLDVLSINLGEMGLRCVGSNEDNHDAIQEAFMEAFNGSYSKNIKGVPDEGDKVADTEENQQEIAIIGDDSKEGGDNVIFDYS